MASLKIKTAFAKQYEAAEYKLKGAFYYIWPVLVIITSIIFMILQLTSDPKMTIASIVLLPISLIFYFSRKKKLEASGVSLDQQILDGMNE